MSAIVLRGDARALPLPDASVDLIVTSPPYFALRSYTDGGEHYAGQIGSEPTPAEYVAALLDCTREWARVLKPSGSLFVNLGDKYSQRVAIRPSSHQDGLFPDRPELRKSWRRDKAEALTRMPHQNIIDEETGQHVREKSLIGLPWRYALGCIDQLGLILRAEIVWSKPNGLPESVTDRVRRSHENWFHFTRLPRYFAAVDEIREPHTSPRHAPGNRGTATAEQIRGLATASKGISGHLAEPDRVWGNPLGKLPGSVWDIPSEPLTVPEHLGIDHFAAFPTEWPKRIIAGWSPSGICTACGEGRRPVTLTSLGRKERETPAYGAGRHGTPGSTLGSRGPSATITGYACACAEPTAPTTPATVLDPFGGTGTVALAADALGRIGITVDRSADYCRLAQWRTQDPGQRAKVLGVAKPPVQIDGQGDLLADLIGAAS